MNEAMTYRLYAEALDLPPPTIAALLDLPLADFQQHAVVRHLFDTLDIERLKASLSQARTAFAHHLPPFYTWLREELGVSRVPESPSHLTNWVIAYLEGRLPRRTLIGTHLTLSSTQINASVPHLLAVCDHLEAGPIRHEWHKTLGALCLMLEVAARERERQRAVGPL
jgi:hypothetical protein